MRGGEEKKKENQNQEKTLTREAVLPVCFLLGWQLRLCKLYFIFGKFLSTSLLIFLFPRLRYLS